MDWSLFLDYFLKALGSLAASTIIALGSVLFAKLKAKIGEARLNTYIDRCVKAAEQLFPNLGHKTGEEKYEYVLGLVKEKYPKLSNERLKPLIEGAVYAVSEQVKQIANINKENNDNNISSVLKIQ